MTYQVVEIEVKKEFKDVGKNAGDGFAALGVVFLVIGSVFLTPMVGIPMGLILIALGKIIELLRLIRLDIRKMRRE